MIRNRVLFVLVVAGIAAALFLAFLTHAPNRLLSGRAIPLIEVAHGELGAGLVLALPLLLGPFLPQRPWTHRIVIGCAGLLVVDLAALAGFHAADLAAIGRRAERTSLGGAFWVLVPCAMLAIHDAERRLQQNSIGQVVVALAIAAAIGT